MRKTTVEIPDELLRRARQVAAAEGTTLRALVESGLRSEIDLRQGISFVLPDASFGGNGTRQGVSEGDWATVDAID
jgi:hypothetical protein